VAAARLKPRAPSGSYDRSSASPIVVGLISDTHGLWRTQIAKIFDGAELIIHAGDVGGRSVLESLQRIARVVAVFGNVDDPHDPTLARERSVTLGGVSIHVSHGHELGRATPEAVLARYAGDVVVFGHTHRAVVFRNPSGRLAVNPGAAGPRRFELMPSVARLTIGRGTPQVEIISLA
jgi:putative phosphoesterase